MFTTVFDKTAERMMTVTSSATALIFRTFIKVLAFLILVFLVLKFFIKKKEIALEQTKKDVELLNTPLNKINDPGIDDLKDRYKK